VGHAQLDSALPEVATPSIDPRAVLRGRPVDDLGDDRGEADVSADRKEDNGQQGLASKLMQQYNTSRNREASGARKAQSSMKAHDLPLADPGEQRVRLQRMALAARCIVGPEGRALECALADAARSAAYLPRALALLDALDPVDKSRMALASGAFSAGRSRR
jgi:hypothetical protein